jgi:hypothetical protein
MSTLRADYFILIILVLLVSLTFCISSFPICAFLLYISWVVYSGCPLFRLVNKVFTHQKEKEKKKNQERRKAVLECLSIHIAFLP